METLQAKLNLESVPKKSGDFFFNPTFVTIRKKKTSFSKREGNYITFTTIKKQLKLIHHFGEFFAFSGLHFLGPI